MHINSLRLVIALGIAVAACGPAAAGVSNSNVAVNTVIANVCVISAPTAISFPGFTGSQVTVAVAAVSSLCTNGYAYSVTADQGQNHANVPVGAGGVSRAMSNAGSYLGYELYTDAGFLNVWGAMNALHGTGNGSAQGLMVYGKLPAQPVPPTGTYSDVVVASVVF